MFILLMSHIYITPVLWLFLQISSLRPLITTSVISCFLSCLTRYVHEITALQPVHIRGWGRWEALLGLIRCFTKHICMHVNELAKWTGQGTGRMTNWQPCYVFQHPISVLISKTSCMPDLKLFNSGSQTRHPSVLCIC